MKQQKFHPRTITILLLAITAIIGGSYYFFNNMTMEKAKQNPPNPLYQGGIGTSENFAKAYFAGGCFWCME